MSVLQYVDGPCHVYPLSVEEVSMVVVSLLSLHGFGKSLYLPTCLTLLGNLSKVVVRVVSILSQRLM